MALSLVRMPTSLLHELGNFSIIQKGYGSDAATNEKWKLSEQGVRDFSGVGLNEDKEFHPFHNMCVNFIRQEVTA